MMTMAPPLFFSESDLRIFLQEAPRLRNQAARNWFTVIGVLVVTVAAFFGVNYTAFLRLNEVGASQVTITTPVIQPVVAVSSDQNVSAAVPTPTPAPTIPSDTLAYDGLGISAPIHWNVPFDEATIQKQLLTGVTHLAGTATPGQQGYVVIVGHSSNFFWVKGSYNTVFAPLLKASVGQEIIINYQNQEYRYRVSKIYQVQPDDLRPLQDGNGNGLRLITCAPLGTSLRRLVVEAVQISPDPSTNTFFTHASFTGQVPAAR